MIIEDFTKYQIACDSIEQTEEILKTLKEFGYNVEDVEEEELKTHFFTFKNKIVNITFNKKENKFIFGNIFEERAFGEPINIMTYNLFINLSYKILNKQKQNKSIYDYKKTIDLLKKNEELKLNNKQEIKEQLLKEFSFFDKVNFNNTYENFFVRQMLDEKINYLETNCFLNNYQKINSYNFIKYFLKKIYKDLYYDLDIRQKSSKEISYNDFLKTFSSNDYYFFKIFNNEYCNNNDYTVIRSLEKININLEELKKIENNIFYKKEIIAVPKNIFKEININLEELKCFLKSIENNKIEVYYRLFYDFKINTDYKKLIQKVKIIKE